MQVTFPAGCDNPGKRIAWCERAEEKVRIVHNKMGEWYEIGLTLTEYNQFPNKVKNKYPYAPQLSETDWQGFVLNVYRKVIKAIMTARNIEWDNAKQDNTTWSPDLDGDIS